MNNFLDKVELQHVVEKIKELLSGYIQLEKGGTIGTDAPTTTLKGGNITLEGVFVNMYKPKSFIKSVEITEKFITGTSLNTTDTTFLINENGITIKKFITKKRSKCARTTC